MWGDSSIADKRYAASLRLVQADRGSERAACREQCCIGCRPADGIAAAQALHAGTAAALPPGEEQEAFEVKVKKQSCWSRVFSR